MILEKQSFSLQEYDSTSFITIKQLLGILEKAPLFKDDLIRVFEIDERATRVLQVGNAKHLLSAINTLDSQCEKIDFDSKIRDVQLKKMLDNEKALFDIFAVKENSLLVKNRSDILTVETRYNAKSDLLDYYNLNKFANYCRDNEYDDLLQNIKSYLQKKNLKNEEERRLRVLHKKEDNKFYLRAITSTNGYKDFGINFSAFVALIALSKYVEEQKQNIFINNFVVDDSNIYISFAFSQKTPVNKNLNLSFSLILDNDEVKRNAVSFNGLFMLEYIQNGKKSEVYLKPHGMKKEDSNYPIDLLSYQHRGSVENVFEKIKELPSLIDYFIKQTSKDAEKISAIKHPDDVRKYLSDKVKNAKKPEFKVYKEKVFSKLMSITVDSTFKLFELIREVEELFEHDDVISLNFWRTKLYESLVERK